MTHGNFKGRSRWMARLGVLMFGAVAVSYAVAEDNQKEVAKGSPSVANKADPAVKPSGGHHEVPDVVAEPADYRVNDYRAPVPATLKGATVIEGEEAHKLHDENTAIFIDVYPRAPKPPNLPKNTVWRDPPHMSIMGTHWLPNVGYGVLAPHVEAYFKRHLERLTGGDKSKPVVFFCLKDCWMSWNAGKRAVEWGYSSVIWFSDGTDGWQEAGGNLTPIKAVKD